MLVLSRKTGERIVIGDGVIVTVIAVGSDRVRLGICAPPATSIHREEVTKRIQRILADPIENRAGTQDVNRSQEGLRSTLGRRTT
jgi:carbon storage regulator